MRVLTSVKMDLLQAISSACENSWNIQSMSKARFIVDAAAGSCLSLSKVGD